MTPADFTEEQFAAIEWYQSGEWRNRLYEVLWRNADPEMLADLPYWTEGEAWAAFRFKLRDG